MKKNALLVPQRAVQDIQGVHQIAIVKPDDTVDVRAVQVGARVGPRWIIAQGATAGERVIVEGAERVRAGQKVRIEASPATGPGPSK